MKKLLYFHYSNNSWTWIRMQAFIFLQVTLIFSLLLFSTGKSWSTWFSRSKWQSGNVSANLNFQNPPSPTWSPKGIWDCNFSICQIPFPWAKNGVLLPNFGIILDTTWVNDQLWKQSTLANSPLNTHNVLNSSVL